MFQMLQATTTTRSIYKVARWVVLLMLAFALLASLRRPVRPTKPASQADSKVSYESFNEKASHLADAHTRGETTEARFSAAEINSAIANSVTGALGNTQPQSSGTTFQPASPLSPQSEGPANSPIQTVDVNFLADQVVGQFSTEVYGKQVYITIKGKLGSKDGYVTFEPTSFQVGDLEVPVSLVNDALQRKLAEPENREKLKLPDYISDLHVENGELVISEK